MIWPFHRLVFLESISNYLIHNIFNVIFLINKKTLFTVKKLKQMVTLEFEFNAITG